MKKLYILMTLLVGLTATNTFASDKKMETQQPPKAELFMNLPSNFNSPASADFDKEGNIYFTSPNFHNDALIKKGEFKTPKAPTIGKITKDNKLSAWYTFKPEDMEKTSGQVAPMGIAFGPDGNAYVADMQLWAGGESRILRLNVKDGQVTSVDVVAKGFRFPNAVVWKGNDMFVSDTDLGALKDGRQVSGIYKISKSELDKSQPVDIAKYVDDSHKDKHLFEKFISNGKLHFGANGLAFDGQGSLYTTMMEEGSVYKTTLDKNNNKVKTTLFATGMVATDGMKWDKRTNKLYVADLFDNAIYSVDMKGKLQLLAKNGDTDGADGGIDGPSELIVRGDEVIVMNFDAVFDSPDMVNSGPDKHHTLSVIKLKK